MNTNRRKAGLALAVVAMSSLLSTGCWDGLISNIWKGFGYSIGGAPADLLIGYVNGFLFPEDTTDETTE